MKNQHLNYFLLLLIQITFFSCTKNFDNINIDPTKVSSQEFDPNFLLTYAELDYGNIDQAQLYEFSCAVQVFASTFDTYGGGDKYNSIINLYNSSFFNEGMMDSSQLIEAQNLAISKDSLKYHNLIQISRIFWVLVMQRLTDIYGDIPYSQAGLGKFGIITPVYDKQSFIYEDMLSRLEDAIKKLDKNKPPVTGDLIYSGNITQWIKFGNAIMLRIAMRLTKINPALAQIYVEKAANNTFTSIGDNALLNLDGGANLLTINRSTNSIRNGDFRQLRWSQTFINYLLANNDPRLYSLTEKADTGLAFNNDISHNGLNYTIKILHPVGFINEVPIGMPNGFDLGGSNSITNSFGYPGPTGTGINANPIGNYARPKINALSAFSNVKMPMQLITYAQTELLLAEATVRGWKTGTTTATIHFNNGVQAAIQGLPQLDPSLSVNNDDIQTFIASRVLDVSTLNNSLNMINSEYWVASLFDFPETWSNWRRSGYPFLVPVNYPGNITMGTIPRRLPYPKTEAQFNSLNYQVAIKELAGGDVPTARMWWDK